MRRQLYRGGGITSLRRQKYGLGDFVRKLIPNELADIAVKAAPFVAPFNPGVAGLMRGIGRYDQRGSLSDALKQGALTYGFGKGAGMLGGAESGPGFFGGQTYTKEGFMNEGVGRLFAEKDTVLTKDQMADKLKKAKSIENTPGFMQRATEATIGKVPGLKALPPMVQQKLLVGGAISGASALASYFKGDFRPQEEGESMEEYLAARKDVVGKQMRIYMDNYFKFDPEYSQLDDAGKNAFVARYNVAQGGRIGYQTGGISMANTLAQNRAINEAQRQAVNEKLQGARDVQKATQELDSYFGRGSSMSNPNLQSFVEKNFLGGTPIQRAAGFNFSGAVEDPFKVTGYNLKDRAGIINTIASNYAQERRNQAAKENAQKQEALTMSQKSEAYGKMMEQKLLDAYGRGTTNFQDLMSGKPYKAEAATLNMPTEAYMDYLLTSDPQNIRYQYRKQDPYYDPQFDMPRDPNEIQELSPLNMYYQRELQRQKEAGLPTGQQIQYGQVMGMPGAIPIGGTAATNTYESYADALARTKAAMGLNQGGRVGQMRGTGPNGLPGIPRQAPDGMEFDMRENGGFQPLGAKEKKDDVPAMLAKNEFVMTADAVRGAGNGDIELGAQKMYDTMKNLERRVT